MTRPQRCLEQPSRHPPEAGSCLKPRQTWLVHSSVPTADGSVQPEPLHRAMQGLRGRGGRTTPPAVYRDFSRPKPPPCPGITHRRSLSLSNESGNFRGGFGALAYSNRLSPACRGHSRFFAAGAWLGAIIGQGIGPRVEGARRLGANQTCAGGIFDDGYTLRIVAACETLPIRLYASHGGSPG